MREPDRSWRLEDGTWMYEWVITGEEWDAHVSYRPLLWPYPWWWTRRNELIDLIALWGQKSGRAS